MPWRRTAGLVGVVDLGPATPPRSAPQRRQGKSLVEGAAQLPAPHPAGELVHEDLAIGAFLPEPDVCHISNPELIGVVHHQALGQVRVAAEVVPAVVVRRHRAEALPLRPISAISRRTRFPLTVQPSRRSMTVIRR
jgi:hypothetical protein